jgi:hypothetical protein
LAAGQFKCADESSLVVGFGPRLDVPVTQINAANSNSRFEGIEVRLKILAHGRNHGGRRQQLTLCGPYRRHDA